MIRIMNQYFYMYLLLFFGISKSYLYERKSDTLSIAKIRHRPNMTVSRLKDLLKGFHHECYMYLSNFDSLNHIILSRSVIIGLILTVNDAMRYRGIVTSSPECCKQRFVWLTPDRILFLAIRGHRTAEFPDILYDVSHSVRFPIRCPLLLWKEHSEIQRFVRVKIFQSILLTKATGILFSMFFSIFNNQIPINNLRKFISFTFSIRSIHPSIYLSVHPSINACMHPSIHLSHCTSIQMNTRTSNYQFIYPFQD